MRNLLLSAFTLVCLLPMNAQTVNTRIYPAEKLAKVKAKADTPAQTISEPCSLKFA